MNAPWAIRLARANAAALASLRLHPVIEVGELGDGVWIRGATCDAELEPLLRSLPADARFTWGEGDLLRAQGSRIPSMRLPPLRWRPLSDWLQVTLPVVQAAFPGHRRVLLQLVRTSEEQDINLLTTPLEQWRGFALKAPDIRLSTLRFAVSSDGTAAIWGWPCPPICGTRWVERCGIAVPAGFSWAPRVSEEVVRRAFELEEGTLLLWHEDSRISRIREEQFVAATRPHIRAARTRTFHAT